MMPSPLTGKPTLGDEVQLTSPNDEVQELKNNEYGFILDTVLKPSHRKNEKIIMFIESFIRCKNIAQASQECGINYSIGYTWRNKADIAAAIQKLIDLHAVKYGFDASEVVERAKEIMDFDPIELQNPDGTYKTNLHDVSPEARRSLKKLKVKNIWADSEDMNGMKTKIIVGEIIEYEFHDKMKALDMVGKEKELFKSTQKIEHTVSKDMASILLGSLQRSQNHIAEIEKKKTINIIPNRVINTNDADYEEIGESDE